MDKNRDNGEQNTGAYGKILKYTGLFGGVQVLQILISVVRNKCAALFIGRFGMGITDILNRTTDMFSALTNLGIPLSGVRSISAASAGEQRDKLLSSIATIRLWSLMTGIFGCMLCAVLSEQINKCFFAGELPLGFLAIASPVILFMAVYGGEAAILKGTRNLRQLASVSVVGSAISLVITIALYLLAGIDGIPWALMLGSATLLVSALTATARLFPWNPSIVFSRAHLRAGKALMALGISYVAAGFAGTGAEMLVRSFISQGSISDVGLYASGFVLCVTYTRIVFVAMDADYFPRLSAASADQAERNSIVSRQIDVCVLLMAPMLIALLTFLPLIVRILYTQEFSGAIGMCIGAAGYLFAKAIIAPIEYIPLAKGDSITYFVMELAYDIIFVLLLMAGYRTGGLQGAGLALTASYLIDLLMVLIVYKKLYGYSIKGKTAIIILVQGIMVFLTFLMFLTGYSVLKYVLGGALIIVSATYSIRKLNLSWSKIRQSVSKITKKK